MRAFQELIRILFGSLVAHDQKQQLGHPLARDGSNVVLLSLRTMLRQRVSKQ